MGDMFAHEEAFILLTRDKLIEYKEKLLQLNNHLKATDKLLSFNKTFSLKKLVNQVNKFEAIILAIDCSKKRFTIECFDEKENAVEAYNTLEVQIDDDDNHNFVLVEIDEIRNIQKAYPNYLIDTSEFVKKFQYYTTTYYWTPK